MFKFILKNWWIPVALLVLAVWLATAFLYNPLPSKAVTFQDYWAWRGTYGDMFGAANCLFSAFVVIGVAYGIVQQREELKEARQSAETQRFYAQFFYLIDKIDTNRQKIKFETKTGRDAIVAISSRLDREDAQSHASLYLMNIWNILNLIDSQPIDLRKGYVHILTGCLSVPEFKLMYKYADSVPEGGLNVLVKKYYPNSSVKFD